MYLAKIRELGGKKASSNHNKSILISFSVVVCMSMFVGGRAMAMGQLNK
jgi:hypothetical protein